MKHVSTDILKKKLNDCTRTYDEYYDDDVVKRSKYNVVSSLVMCKCVFAFQFENNNDEDS